MKKEVEVLTEALCLSEGSNEELRTVLMSESLIHSFLISCFESFVYSKTIYHLLWKQF